MPINPTYPGVYIEEIPSGVHTITGVATSIAAFLGRTAKGPLNNAVRCFNYSDFTRAFGGAHAKSDLADSVRLFFTNGGTECYVIRLAKGAEKSSITLKSFEKKKVLVATAKAEGEWGDTVRIEVDYNTSNPDDSFNMNVIHESGGRVVTTEQHSNLSMNPSSPRFAQTFVTQSSRLIELNLHSFTGDPENPSDPNNKINKIANSFKGFSQARRPLGDDDDVGAFVNSNIKAAGEDRKSMFEISVNGSPYVVVDLKDLVINDIPPANPGDPPLTTPAEIATDIKDLVNNALATVTPTQEVNCSFITEGDVKNLLTIVSDKGDFSAVHVRRASSYDISGVLMLGIEQGGIEWVRWSNFRPAATVTFWETGTVPHANPKKMTETLNKLAAVKQDDFTSITIDSIEVNLNDPANYDLTTTADADNWIKSADGPGSVHGGNDGVREKLDIIAQAINDNTLLPYKAEVWGYHLVLKSQADSINSKPVSITTTPASVEFTDGFEDHFNVRRYTLGTGSTTGVDYFVSNGVKGTDGDAPDDKEFIGNLDKQTGFHALDVVDIFNLMVIPGDEEITDINTLYSIWSAASNYCLAKRAFFLVDAPRDWTDPKTGLAQVVQKTKKVGDLRSKVTNISSAVFYPPLKYKASSTYKLLGPSGALAGLMARTDAARGVWKAPAGTEADLRGILGLEVKLTDQENGVLNKLAVNCLREFPGSYVSWGARTLAGYDNNSSTEGTDWKYIPVRRLALFLEESLFRGTKWVVFEPNDEPLWAKIRLNVGAFMMRLFKQGAFQGSTPDKAFYVKCDSETTPQADINLGIVNIEVGFAPLKPAEFVIIKIQQMAGEL